MPQTPSPVESVDRALLALQALARAGAKGMTLAELAVASVCSLMPSARATTATGRQVLTTNLTASPLYSGANSRRSLPMLGILSHALSTDRGQGQSRLYFVVWVRRRARSGASGSGTSLTRLVGLEGTGRINVVVNRGTPSRPPRHESGWSWHFTQSWHRGVAQRRFYR